MKAHGTPGKIGENYRNISGNVTFRHRPVNGPDLPGYPGRVPWHQPGLELDPQRLEVPVVQLPEQDADRGAAQFGERLANRGQRGDDDARLDGVVEADNRAVAGDAQPARGGLLHDPDGHAVVEREYRGRRFCPVKQRRRLLATAVDTEVRIPDQRLVW